MGLRGDVVVIVLVPSHSTCKRVLKLLVNRLHLLEIHVPGYSTHERVLKLFINVRKNGLQSWFRAVQPVTGY